MARRSPASAPAADTAEVDKMSFDEMEVDAVEIGPDAEFIKPQKDLRSKAKARAKRGDAPDPVEAAEAALARMAGSFEGWMTDETVRLIDLFGEAELADFDGESLSALHRAAHDIKGQAATLGFPLAGRIASGLCRLIEAKFSTGRFAPDLARQHVQSVRAIISEQARDDGSPTARRLAERLDEVTGDFLEQIGVAA